MTKIKVKYAESHKDNFFLDSGIKGKKIFDNGKAHHILTNRPIKKMDVITIQSGQNLVALDDFVKVDKHTFNMQTFTTYRNLFRLSISDAKGFVRPYFLSPSMTFEIKGQYDKIDMSIYKSKSDNIEKDFEKFFNENSSNMDKMLEGKDQKPTEIEKNPKERDPSNIIKDGVLIIQFEDDSIRQAVLSKDDMNILFNVINEHLGGIKVLDEVITSVEFKKE